MTPPATLGAYRLDRLLGSGSSASVYLAQDLRDGGWLALKLLSPGALFSGLPAAERRQRFEQEAAIARRLRHPDIVGLLDAGETAGQPWLAIELAPGCSLLRYGHPARLLPVPLVLGIGARLALALDHAHGLGVLHRDVKPSNVLLHLPSRSLKITDFGTARLLDGMSTRTEVLLGTPVYMAPELLAGEHADARCDLYSLGVLLFELLAGRLPYQSDSMGDLLRQVASQPMPRLRDLRPDLPPAVADAVQALLEKSRLARPASAREVATRLLTLAPPWTSPEAVADPLTPAEAPPSKVEDAGTPSGGAPTAA